MQPSIKRSDSGTRGRPASLISRLLLAVLALTLLPAFAAGPASRGAPERNPRLANLQIEIWPEFDRPAVLVILRGALAADVVLPADVTLRIPAASGGPSALAYSTAAAAELLNLEHQRTDAKDFITLRFKVPQRYFHVEFYDPLATGAPARSYTYTWPGDFGVNRFSVLVQEPAAASDFSVQPNLDASTTGPDGLRYRSAELGVHEAGKPLPITLRYSRTETRTSAEILQRQAPVATPAPAAGSGEDVTKWVLLVVLVLSLLIGSVTAVMWWRGRRQAS
jgi:hypothetical protein